MPNSQIKVAMVTGHHEYDVINFQRMLRSFPDIDFYPQHLEDFILDDDEARSQYDVIAFYNYQQCTPSATGDQFSKDIRVEWERVDIKGPLEALGETCQGILMLHHALTAFPKWQYWLDICGMGDTTKAFQPGAVSRKDQNLHIEVADPHHPITRGMESWEMIDETYNFPDAREGSEVLLRVDHPQSMSTIAWTRKHKDVRVFCLQSGHDNQTFSNPNFRKILGRGVHWLAGRI
jgi:hypothetical protein